MLNIFYREEKPQESTENRETEYDQTKANLRRVQSRSKYYTHRHEDSSYQVAGLQNLVPSEIVDPVQFPESRALMTNRLMTCRKSRDMVYKNVRLITCWKIEAHNSVCVSRIAKRDGGLPITPAENGRTSVKVFRKTGLKHEEIQQQRAITVN